MIEKLRTWYDADDVVNMSNVESNVIKDYGNEAKSLEKEYSHGKIRGSLRKMEYADMEIEGKRF